LTITNSNASAVDTINTLTLGSSDTISSAFTLTLSGNVGLTTSITDNSGFTLAGANDNANINFSLTDVAPTSTSAVLPSNTIVLGNGNDQITLTSNLTNSSYSGVGLTNNITVGTGTNSITLNDTNNSTTATVSDIIKFADNSAVFNSTTSAHLTTVTLNVSGSSVNTPATNVSFNLSSVLGNTPLNFDSTAATENSPTSLTAALSAAVTQAHSLGYNAGYFTYGTTTINSNSYSNTYLFVDSQTNPGHEAIIELIGGANTNTHAMAVSTGDIVHVTA
jgi:hypothetical protein